LDHTKGIQSPTLFLLSRGEVERGSDDCSSSWRGENQVGDRNAEKRCSNPQDDGNLKSIAHAIWDSQHLGLFGIVVFWMLEEERGGGMTRGEGGG
jgi:hypothetical protein